MSEIVRRRIEAAQSWAGDADPTLALQHSDAVLIEEGTEVFWCRRHDMPVRCCPVDGSHIDHGPHVVPMVLLPPDALIRGDERGSHDLS